jgi:hypothetical protein
VAKYTLQNIHDLAYRWGDCQAILYDPVREDIFPPPYLTHLYNLCRQSGRAKLGILEPLFCGMRDLSHNAITAYLHTLKLVVLGEWREVYKDYEDGGIFSPMVTVFHPLGFCFLSTEVARGATTASAFGAYAFFQEAWRTDQQMVLTMCGLAYLFQENGLSSLHGIRYADNKLTARWMQKFGFRDVGTLNHQLFQPSLGELVAGTVSTLAREDFETRLSAALELGEKLEAD